MDEMMELMHQLLLGNGILIAGCVYVCAELLKTLLPRMNSTWIPLIGALMGVLLGLIIPDCSVGQGMLVKAISGLCLGWAATGAFESVKCIKSRQRS